MGRLALILSLVSLAVGAYIAAVDLPAFQNARHAWGSYSPAPLYGTDRDPDYVVARASQRFEDARLETRQFGLGQRVQKEVFAMMAAAVPALVLALIAMRKRPRGAATFALLFSLAAIGIAGYSISVGALG